jgi:hypothetical protein
MVYSRIIGLITSLFYISSDRGNLRKSTTFDMMIAKDYIPKNQKDTFFISYKNNLRKDLVYKDGKFNFI